MESASAVDKGKAEGFSCFIVNFRKILYFGIAHRVVEIISSALSRINNSQLQNPIESVVTHMYIFFY